MINLKNCQTYRRLVSGGLSILIAVVACWLLATPSALAGLNDDRFDGDIFALYGSNASLVPPRVNLAESLKRNKPALLVFYVNDSSDCKLYSVVISQLQAPYGRAANFIPINIDTLPLKSNYKPMESGYYYKGLVPQTVLFNQEGKVVLNETGQLSYEQIDDVFRDVFNLLPRSESIELKRRTLNEINTELRE
ncbi:thylakoid membrane photosystem I accumulation factor [Coleofasciculus sp. LEGE 07081]|uniref:thylakoid membrane photosystem I accumulation factor n=1 Tax=Coleofasciculus sp. LEGE 07081 TaxID=2777967 RepID=UPI0034DB56FF